MNGILLLFLIISPLLLPAAEPKKNELTAEAYPSVIQISLPASITSVLENPDEAEKLFIQYQYPRNAFLSQMEISIEQEVRNSGEKNTAEILKRRRIQNLIAKVEFLYLKANSNADLMKGFLKLNGLPPDFPARADDNVFEILEQVLWKPDAGLKAEALRQRPETTVKNNNMIKLLIQIQLDMANALYGASEKEPENRTIAAIEIANIAAVPPPQIVYGKPVELIFNPSTPIFTETAFPVLDLYSTLFKVTDWKEY